MTDNAQHKRNEALHYAGRWLRRLWVAGVTIVLCVVGLLGTALLAPAGLLIVSLLLLCASLAIGMTIVWVLFRFVANSLIRAAWSGRR